MPRRTPRRAPSRRGGTRARPRRQLALVVRLRDADRGAEPGRLDEDRVAERVVDRVAGAQRHVAGDRHAAVAQHRLEQVLVHAERRRGDAGADVRDAGELEQPLHRPVLAEGPVQDGKTTSTSPSVAGDARAPGPAASRRPSSAVASAALAAPGGRAPSGRRGRSRPSPPRSARGRAPEHRARRGERDLVLARAAAHEDGDASARGSRRRRRSASAAGRRRRRRRGRRSVGRPVVVDRRRRRRRRRARRRRRGRRARSRSRGVLGRVVTSVVVDGRRVDDADAP